jgi:hypothetical protein
MFTHVVMFWLKPGMTTDDVADFETKLRALTMIPSVVYGTVGKPASTDRPVIDRSYHYGLMVAFKDLAGHDLYQDHPVHDTFRNECGKFFDRVVIYDYEG